MTRILCTGGAGFLGSHFVDYLLKETDWQITVWDSLNYSSHEAWRLRQINAFDSERFDFRKLDLADFIAEPMLFDFIVHLAAETHVDRSIKDARPFVLSNVVGTFNLLEYARKIRGLKKFLFFSTDEVYGPANGEPFTEWSAHNPSNPYAATKSAAENLSMSWANTYGLPIVVSHCCNIFGERQHEEKYIPILVKAIRGGHRVGIHCDENGKPGSRMYVYAGDVARAISLLLDSGEVREKYNIPGREIDNEQMAVVVGLNLGMTVDYSYVQPFQSRPGWDFRYSIGGENLQKLGWEPTKDFAGLLKKTVEAL